jgi:hypothetical protein
MVGEMVVIGRNGEVDVVLMVLVVDDCDGRRDQCGRKC